MAKRKAARAGGKKAGASRKTASRTRAKARKAAPRRAAKTAARRPAKAARRPAKASPRVAKARTKPARARKAAAPRSRAVARKPVRKTVKRAAPKAAARQVPRSRPAVRAKAAAPSKVEARKAPALNRERRVIHEDDDIIQGTPPSSLDLDRSASSARSGRRTLRDKYAAHTQTGPALTGGDVDADWESAYSVGDEAPGGDSPTPDQDIVDDIGRAVGVEYQDNEELKGADKVAKRDKNRWELDPASSDDWEDR